MENIINHILSHQQSPTAQGRTISKHWQNFLAFWLILLYSVDENVKVLQNSEVGLKNVPLGVQKVSLN